MWGAPPTRGSSSLCGRGQYVQATKYFGRQISFFSVFRPWDLGKGFTRACSELYPWPSSPPTWGGGLEMRRMRRRLDPA